MKSRQVWIKIGQILLIAVITLIFVFPFWWMVVSSLNTNAELFGKPSLLPRSWQWSNYVEIFRMQPFARQLVNSLFVAAVGTAGNVIVAAFSGYAFAKLRFPGRNKVFILLLTALMMPCEVIIIPLYFQLIGIGLSDSLVPLVLIPIFGAQGAFSVFLFRSFFITVPDELIDAARLDGLSHFGVFTKIMLPSAKPAIATSAVLAFLTIWNAYLEPLVFTGSVTKYTLALALSNFNDVYGQPQWELQMAATTVSVLPVLALYLIFRKKIMEVMNYEV